MGSVVASRPQTKRHFVRPEHENFESVRAFLYMVQHFTDHLAKSPYQKFSVIYDRRNTSLANADVWLLKKLLKILQVRSASR
jgi:hypothetical protein